VTESECMFVNVDHYYVVLYYVFDCCFGLYNSQFTALSKPCAAIWQRVYYRAKLRMLCYVHTMIRSVCLMVCETGRCQSRAP